MESFNLEQFLNEIEVLVDKDISYSDAICSWCEHRGIEIEAVAAIIKKTPVLKSKIFDSAKKLRMVKSD